MSPNTQRDDDMRARAFIDRIVEINRKYGMGDEVSEDTYQRAVEKSSTAYAGLIAKP